MSDDEITRLLRATLDAAVSYIFALEGQKEAVVVRARRAYEAALRALDEAEQLDVSTDMGDVPDMGDIVNAVETFEMGRRPDPGPSAAELNRHSAEEAGTHYIVDRMMGRCTSCGTIGAHQSFCPLYDPGDEFRPGVGLHVAGSASPVDQGAGTGNPGALGPVTYDPRVGAAYVAVRPHDRVARTVRVSHDNVMFDYDSEGRLLGVEVLDIVEAEVVPPVHGRGDLSTPHSPNRELQEPDPSSARCTRCNVTALECATQFEDVGFGPMCCEDCSHRVTDIAELQALCHLPPKLAERIAANRADLEGLVRGRHRPGVEDEQSSEDVQAGVLSGSEGDPPAVLADDAPAGESDAGEESGPGAGETPARGEMGPGVGGGEWVDL